MSACLLYDKVPVCFFFLSHTQSYGTRGICVVPLRSQISLTFQSLPYLYSTRCMYFKRHLTAQSHPTFVQQNPEFSRVIPTSLYTTSYISIVTTEIQPNVKHRLLNLNCWQFGTRLQHRKPSEWMGICRNSTGALVYQISYTLLQMDENLQKLKK